MQKDNENEVMDTTLPAQSLGEMVHKAGQETVGQVSAKKKKKLRFSLMIQIMIIATAPLLLTAVLLAVLGVQSVSEGMTKEILEGFKMTATSVNSAYNAIDGGAWHLAGTDLMKGNYNVTQNRAQIDSFTEGLDADVTVFFGDTRYATSLIDKKTGERIVGSKCASEVYDAVVKNGEVYSATDLTINEQEYFATYIPLKGSNGKSVGMIFVGAPSKELHAYIYSATRKIIIVSVAIFLAAIALVIFCMIGVRKGLGQAGNAVTRLASGTLDVKVPDKYLKRSNEIGDMVRGIKTLKDELVNVIGNIKTSSNNVAKAGEELSATATQTNNTADEISRAVEDISKGAVAQAEEIENASAKIEMMGQMIEQIVSGVSTLDDASEIMQAAGDESSIIIQNLRESSDKTLEAIEHIGEQVSATNDSANKISAAIELIASIADETNLLSLNASIEAARAGEQGRGFAVVANQIQKLAEQSNETALRIAEIIKELLEDSQNSVTVMEQVRKIVDEQQKKLEETGRQFEEVQKGISRSREETKDIKKLTTVCDEARVGVVDVISNLSAISEENAASTQETTASMEELNATINLLADSAGNLEELATSLQNHINFFRI